MSTPPHVGQVGARACTGRRRWETSWSSGCARGASNASSAIPATASTGRLRLSNMPETRARASSRRAMRAVRVHGRSACQVHRRARGVSGHSRPRGDPPPQRVVRRRNGPPARLSHDLRVRVVLCAESSGEEIRLHSEPEAESSQRDSDCHHSPTLWSGLIPCCPKTHDSEQLAEHHPDNEHGRTQPQSGSPLQKAAWAPHPGVSADST